MKDNRNNREARQSRNAVTFRETWSKGANQLFARGEINLAELFLLLFVASFMPRRMEEFRRTAIAAVMATNPLNDDGSALNVNDDGFDWEAFLEALIAFLRVIIPLFINLPR